MTLLVIPFIAYWRTIYYMKFILHTLYAFFLVALVERK